MISICIPTYDEGLCLIRTVEFVQVVRDELPDCEIVIADDGGTDDSVAECLRRWPDVRVARHPKPYGTSCAKALAADTARGDVLIFLDAHVKPSPGALATLAAAAAEHGVATPTVDGLHVDEWKPNRKHSQGMYVDLASKWQCLWLPLAKLIELDTPGHFESYAIPGQSFAVRRDVYDSIGGWDRGLIAWGSDVSFTLRLYCLGYQIRYVPAARVAHRFATKFQQYQPSWWQIYANRIRTARAIGEQEDIDSLLGSITNQAAYEQALRYADEHDHTIPRLHGRLVNPLSGYLDRVHGLEPWQRIEGWLSPREAAELQRLARGGRVLEIGSYRGRSTVALASVASHVTAVDPHDGATLQPQCRERPSLPDLHRNLARCGLADRVTVIARPIQDVADELPANSFDLVFVDGDHSREACARDIEIAFRMVAHNGSIAVHDYGNKRGVTAAVDHSGRCFQRHGSLAVL